MAQSTQHPARDINRQQHRHSNQSHGRGAEGQANWEMTNNLEEAQDAPNPAMNPRVDLHKKDDIVIEEFFKRQGTIGLDWYVPDLCNTRIGILIKNKLPIYTT